jgi:hypothetical protein
MALDFPNNPTDGQTWEGDNGVVYTFNATGIDGGYWSGTSTGDGDGGGNSNIHIGENPPVSPAPGDLWWDESMDSGRLYIYYQDEGDQGNGNSSQWVEASPSGGFDKNENEYWMKGGSDLKPITDTDNVVIGGSNIRLNANGSAEFGEGRLKIGGTGTGTVILGTTMDWANGTGVGVYQAGGGKIAINCSSTASAFQVGFNGAETIKFLGNGTADFTGDVAVGGPSGGSATQGRIFLDTKGRIDLFRRTGDSDAECLQTFNTASEKTFIVYNTGNVKIGGTLPSAPNITLNADGTIFAAGYVINDLTTGNRIGQLGHSNGFNALSISGLGRRVVVQSSTDGTKGVQLDPNTTAWTAISSESRLKDIVGDPNKDQCWNLIRDIELKRYFYKDQEAEFKESGVPYLGPMADWLEIQDPELVIYNQEDEEGPIRTFNQGLLDMKALQALSTALTRIETLETANASLEARLTALEGAN